MTPRNEAEFDVRWHALKTVLFTNDCRTKDKNCALAERHFLCYVLSVNRLNAKFKSFYETKTPALSKSEIEELITEYPHREFSAVRKMIERHM